VSLLSIDLPELSVPLVWCDTTSAWATMGLVGAAATRNRADPKADTRDAVNFMAIRRANGVDGSKL
jgi:hypothetical protein